MNSRLQSDCEACFGICCVALPYAKSADFAMDKEGGNPCRNLCTDHRCSIHEQLIEKGFHGCVSYECFGAGQHVSQEIYKGKDWREHPELSQEMFSVFPIVQQLHEMLYYLDQALELDETAAIRKQLQTVFDDIAALTKLELKDILNLNVPVHRERVNMLLIEASERFRQDDVQRNKNMMMRKDLLGANLKGADLRGMNLRGALLIAANLRGADLRRADFIGADFRNADVSGADLRECIFLTQAQVNSAKGNRDTKLPRYLKVPDHWLS
ncbi:hypothetical protein FHR92_001413 [Fontibacillus solani]|uniref:Oxetanocin A resistance protein n=1 Tax=Fontibacillus solani TaxID=1572857 RepID=A0A7W3XR03_9BACL|nr:hypothetical protein [Fontibacillus solani]